MFTLPTAFCFRNWLLSLCVVTLSVTASAQSQPEQAPPTKPYTIVYKLKPAPQGARVAANGQQLQQALRTVKAENIHQKFPHAGNSRNTRRALRSDITNIYEASYSPDMSFAQVKRALMATGEVAYVEPLYLREPLYQTSDPHSDSTKTTAFYLKLIQAYSAWNVEQGDTNVVIAILDTGFRTDHEDIKGNIKYNYADPIDGIDNDNDGYTDNFAGWDFADRDNNVREAPRWKSHGMAVAGVASATPDNAAGITGVGNKVKFLPLKIFSSGTDGVFGGGYEAIVYAADKGCQVINLSWGGEGYAQYEQDIINYAVLDRDAVVVASGGNAKTQRNYYPASYANVLSVGASTGKDEKAYTWSHYIDLLAPGMDIYSTSVTGTNTYAYQWGSSFSAPMVAGAAALVRSRFPDLNAQQVMERLRLTTDNIYHIAANQPYQDYLGTGRLNIKKALLQTNLKAVRATHFDIKNNRALQAGSTLYMEAAFQNILDPLSNLQVTLSTDSPYITIANNTFTVGSMATMAEIDNFQSPFQVTIAPQTPINTVVAFRFGFKDDNYSDYQYFEMVVNPDYHTLNANNLHVTVNSKGNLAYNGLEFTQGEGVHYKGSSPLLFEGGLMIGISPQQVSDNLRNANWKNDSDFTPIQHARIAYDTPLATQEVRGLIRDNHPSASTVGVEVKYRTLAWESDPDKDYVIQEFTIRNVTEDTLKNVATGLFADWDIGVYYQNTADWDADRNLGYVYNANGPQLMAGIKLLTPNAPIYYAINNMGHAGSIAIEDGFTNAEKYTTLSGGVTRTNANGNGFGENVSHVVGGLIPAIAPGQTQVVSFAILAGDNLEDLQQHADAAQLKYKTIKTGPAPLATQQTICEGNSYTWAPDGGTTYNFYADPEKQQLLATGNSYTINNFKQDMAIYATNVDSLFESSVGTAQLLMPRTPEADFEAAAFTLFANTPVQFENKSINGANWNWNFGKEATSNEQNPVYTFPEQGQVQVTLSITDEAVCLQDSVTKTFTVREPLSKNKAEMYAQMTDVYPNPTTGIVRINWAADAGTTTSPEFWFSDQVGRRFELPVMSTRAKEVIVDFSEMSNGIYIAHFTYKGVTYTKRVVVLH